MREFTADDDLRGARFDGTNLTGARLHNVEMAGAKISGADLRGVDISGLVDDLRINDVDVAPLIEAELNRRHPERIKLQAGDADGLREAWAVIERSWPPTIERARRLPPDALHERVDEEWSFIETLRHLVFVVDAWVKRALLGDPAPYDPLDLPHMDLGDPSVPHDRGARPGLDEVLALRADRTAVVRDVMARLTDADLERDTDPIPAPGYPPAGTYPVRRCLRAVVIEEWEHRLFAERDLAVIEARLRA